MKSIHLSTISISLGFVLGFGVYFGFAGSADAARNDKRYLRLAAGAYRGTFKRVKATWINNRPYTTQGIPTTRAVYRVPKGRKTTKWNFAQTGWAVVPGWGGKAPTFGKFAKPMLVQNANKVLYRGRIQFDLNLGTPPRVLFDGPFRLSAVDRGKGYVLKGSARTTKNSATGSDYAVKGRVEARK